MRKRLLAGGAGALICGPFAIAFFAGGYFDRPRLIAALVVWAMVAVVAVAVPRPLPTEGPGQIAVAGLVLFCAWTAASVIWAPLGGRAVDDLQRLLLYLGYFVCALALLRPPSVRRWLEPAVALGALVVVGYALSERLLPGLVQLDRSSSAAGRLEQPVSYWNALGLLAAIGLLIAIRVAGDPTRARGLRAGAAGAGVALGFGVYLTFARGALAAVAAGLLVLMALAPAGRPQLRSAVAVIAASALAALLVNGFPAVKSLEQTTKGDAGDGALMLAALVALGVAAAAIVWREPSRPLRVPALPVSRPTVVLTATAGLLVAAVVVVAVFEGKPEVTSPVRGATPERLASVDSNRYRYWEVAVETWADHPVAGVGSGGYLVEWLKQRDRVDTSGDAHSLYFETVAELGIVGFAFLLLFLGGAAAGVVRILRRHRAAGTGLAAALAAFAVHAGLDWDWEIPAVGLLALLLGAAAITGSEKAYEPADLKT